MTGKPSVARHGHRMIEVRIKFWTDKIAAGRNGNIIPKHAWDSGVVVMTANPDHSIKSEGNPEILHSILDLPSTVAKVLTDHGVTLHTDRRSRKLFQPIIDLKHEAIVHIEENRVHDSSQMADGSESRAQQCWNRGGLNHESE